MPIYQTQYGRMESHKMQNQLRKTSVKVQNPHIYLNEQAKYNNPDITNVTLKDLRRASVERDL